MAIRASNNTFEAEIKDGTVLADFYSDSCVPCKRMSSLLAEIEEENPAVKVCFWILRNTKTRALLL